MGKVFILVGVVLTLVGVLLTLVGKLSWLGNGFGWLEWLGRLPGDILIKRNRVTFYFPLATGLLISVVLSLLLYLWTRR
jgi:hypothetical protein